MEILRFAQDDSWRGEVWTRARLWLVLRDGAAVAAIAADFEARDHDVELAFALNLALEAVEKIAFKFLDFSATEAGHVQVIPLWPPLIEVLFPLQMHEIELVDQAMPLQKT